MSVATSERGGASIFVVIFSALLITVITVGFVQLMLRSQQDAMTQDLSQSAYDSAMAGVEDAKRAIDAALGDDTLTAVLNGGACGSVKQVLVGGADDKKEMMIKQDEDDEALAQAYTCVKVDLTPEYVKEPLPKDKSRLIPLRTVNGASFNQVNLKWQFPVERGAVVAQYPEDIEDVLLPRSNEWNHDRPALMRVQLIQYRDQIAGEDFSDTNTDVFNKSLFFIPNSPSGTDTANLSIDDARIIATKCDETGVCNMNITLPANGGPGNPNRYLRLTSLYNDAYFVLSVNEGGGAPRELEGVVAEIDATGRAGDVYRRVQAQVNLGGATMLPEAALDINEKLCKDFTVGTNSVAHYEDKCE